MSHGEKGHRDCHHDQHYCHHHCDCHFGCDCDVTFTVTVIIIVFIVRKMRSHHSNTDQPSYVGQSWLPIQSRKGFKSHSVACCRVAKCHGYDEYIRVNRLADWGKKYGRRWNFSTKKIKKLCKHISCVWCCVRTRLLWLNDQTKISRSNFFSSIYERFARFSLCKKNWHSATLTCHTLQCTGWYSIAMHLWKCISQHIVKDCTALCCIFFSSHIEFCFQFSFLN